jgi:hypothetical protein
MFFEKKQPKKGVVLISACHISAMMHQLQVDMIKMYVYV